MSGVAKRGRGRPKGSKNKRVNLSGATVERICEHHAFNPAEKLISIADGSDTTLPWTKDDRLKATEKLFDAIHNKRPIKGLEGAEDDGPRNYEIVFVESADDFTLPGEAGAEGGSGVLPAP